MSSTLAGALVNRPVPPLPPVSLNEPLANGAVVAARTAGAYCAGWEELFENLIW